MRAGDKVQWKEPLDADYMVGEVVAISGSEAKVECKNYYAGVCRILPVRVLEQIHRRQGDNGSSKKRRHKRRTTKIKLQ